MINGILWKLRTGAPWLDLPDRYGPWKTCHEWLRRWTADGTWDKILAKAIVYDGQPVQGRSASISPWSGHASARLAPGKGANEPASRASRTLIAALIWLT